MYSIKKDSPFQNLSSSLSKNKRKRLHTDYNDHYDEFYNKDDYSQYKHLGHKRKNTCAIDLGDQIYKPSYISSTKHNDKKNKEIKFIFKRDESLEKKKIKISNHPILKFLGNKKKSQPFQPRNTFKLSPHQLNL